MTSVIHHVRTFLVSEDGPTAVEYAVMLVMIVVVCFVTIRSIGTLTRVIADAVAEGLMARAGAQANAGADTKPEAGVLGADEPLPAWEQELLSGSAAEATGAPAPIEGAGAAETPGTEAAPVAAPVADAPQA